jgi:hypothetical protein
VGIITEAPIVSSEQSAFLKGEHRRFLRKDSDFRDDANHRKDTANRANEIESPNEYDYGISARRRAEWVVRGRRGEDRETKEGDSMNRVAF